MPSFPRTQITGANPTNPFRDAICLLLEQFHITHMTQLELASLTHLKVWGDPEKFHSNTAFLLVLPEEGAAGERVYRLVMVWLHPYQARVSMIDDAAKQLTQLAFTGPNWPCALVWLNRDAHHMPLPTEGHLSVIMEGNTGNLPTGGLPTSWGRLPGGLPIRTQWVSSSSGNDCA